MIVKMYALWNFTNLAHTHISSLSQKWMKTPNLLILFEIVFSHEVFQFGGCLTKRANQRT